METEAVEKPDLAQQVKLLSERTRDLEKRCERLDKDQYETFSYTINYRPLLRKYTCGLIDPEAKMTDKMLERGCVIAGTERYKKMVRHTFKKKM